MSNMWDFVNHKAKRWEMPWDTNHVTIIAQKMRKSPVFVTALRSASLKNGFWNYIEANIWDSTVVVCDLCTHTHSHNFAPIGTHLHALTLSHTRTYTHSHLLTLAHTRTHAPTHTHLRTHFKNFGFETALKEKGRDLLGGKRERSQKSVCVCATIRVWARASVCVWEWVSMCAAGCMCECVREAERERVRGRCPTVSFSGSHAWHENRKWRWKSIKDTFSVVQKQLLISNFSNMKPSFVSLS